MKMWLIQAVKNDKFLMTNTAKTVAVCIKAENITPLKENFLSLHGDYKVVIQEIVSDIII